MSRAKKVSEIQIYLDILCLYLLLCLEIIFSHETPENQDYILQK
jgi:hypothetical protein